MEKLLSTCRGNTAADDQQGQKLISYMEKKYRSSCENFKISPEFMSACSEAVELITNNPRKKFVYLTQIISDLKSNQAPANPSANEKPLKVLDENQTEGNGELNSTDEERREKKEKLDRRIKRLEELLEEHRKAIAVEENKELSLDELENDSSSYLIAERLKARYIKIYKRLCTLRSYGDSLGGIRDKSFRYAGSRYKELNYHIQRFINKQSFEERMPDFYDIKRITTKCNEKYSYHLSKKRILEIAKEVFLEVGNIIQRSRQEDFVADFGYSSELNDLMRRSDGDDPALINSTLRRQLDQNKKIAEKRMSDVFSEFSEKQTDEMNKPRNKKIKKDTSGNDNNNEEGDKSSADENSESEESENTVEDENEEEEEILKSIDDVVKSGSVVLDNGESGSVPVNNNSDNETDGEETTSPCSKDEDLGELSGLDNSSSSESETEERELEQTVDFTGKGKALVNGANVCKNPNKEPEVIELFDSD